MPTCASSCTRYRTGAAGRRINQRSVGLASHCIATKSDDDASSDSDDETVRNHRAVWHATEHCLTAYGAYQSCCRTMHMSESTEGSHEQAAVDDDDASSAGPMSARPPLSARGRAATPRIVAAHVEVCWVKLPWAAGFSTGVNSRTSMLWQGSSTPFVSIPL